MPRRNRPPEVTEEGNLARRIAFERERRGWSYDGLAKRMTDAGCPINQSALYKVEKADPPRRITVAELVALSKVLDVPVQDLLQPPEMLAKKQLAELFLAWRDAAEAEHAAAAVTSESWQRLCDYIDTHPDLDDSVRLVVEAWVEWVYPTAPPAEAVAYWMWKITRTDGWKSKALAYFDAGKVE